MKRKVSIKGYLSTNDGHYNLAASLAGGKEFDSEKLFEMALEGISDEKFNKLLLEPRKVEVQFKIDELKLRFPGTILGGSDPTRPLRHNNKKLLPKQNLTILLDEKLDKTTTKMILGEPVKLLINS